MAYPYEYPYTDPNRHNSDWAINKVKELDALFHDTIIDDIKEGIEKYFDTLVISSLYNEENERLVLSVDSSLIVDDGHVYDIDTETIEIGGNLDV